MKVQFNARLSVYNNNIQISTYNRTKGEFKRVPYILSKRGVYIHSTKELCNEEQFIEYANNCNTFVTFEAYPILNKKQDGITYVIEGIRDVKEITNK